MNKRMWYERADPLGRHDRAACRTSSVSRSTTSVEGADSPVPLSVVTLEVSESCEMDAPQTMGKDILPSDRELLVVQVGAGRREAEHDRDVGSEVTAVVETFSKQVVRRSKSVAHLRTVRLRTVAIAIGEGFGEGFSES